MTFLQENPQQTHKVYSVREITQDLKTLIEENFHTIWLKGEISNFKTYASGHHYFTLKDETSQISCVMFKGYNRHLKFAAEDGMAVVLHGRLSIYEARGQYQILVDHMQPDGIGTLQLAFDQLKKKLSAEGLFDPASKIPLPILPQTVGLITSLHGAAIHDMLNIARRRFPNINILIYPVKVQGEGSVEDIVTALKYFETTRKADVIIIGRGGGSLEDLWSFNEEAVVRAVAATSTPIISAVGHETDFCLTDLAADVRAPTPSAAMELALPVKSDLLTKTSNLKRKLYVKQTNSINMLRKHIHFLVKSVPTPQHTLDKIRLKLSDIQDQLFQRTTLNIRNNQLHLTEIRYRIVSPLDILNRLKLQLAHHIQNLKSRIISQRRHIKDQLNSHTLKLKLLSPLNVLQRGYTLIKDKHGKLATSAQQIHPGDTLQVVFHDGNLLATAERKLDPSNKVN